MLRALLSTESEPPPPPEKNPFTTSVGMGSHCDSGTMNPCFRCCASLTTRSLLSVEKLWPKTRIKRDSSHYVVT